MRLTGKAKIAGVMGWPVGHSRSPRLHGYWLAQYGIDGAYVPFAVPPERLETALRALPALGIRGVNLTVPHKEAALAIVDEVDTAARAIGAVNTIVVADDRTLCAFNTDVEGFRANLVDKAPGVDVTKPAVVLGAGGAARAVVAALASLGVTEIRVVNRARARASALAQALGGFGAKLDLLPWTAREDALGGASLLVNTTVLGMAGQAPLDLRLEALPASAVVSDIVYVPLVTELLAAAAARGHRTVDGLGMLLHQARPGFRAWFGVEPEITDGLRADMIAGLGDG